MSSDGSATFTRNASYTARSRRRFPRADGFRWEGYSSTELPFDPACPTTAPPASSPSSRCRPARDGAPFAGPFRWRAVVGFRETGAGARAPAIRSCATCFGRAVCFDSPARGRRRARCRAGSSDLGVLAGRGDSVGQGETAVVVFGAGEPRRRRPRRADRRAVRRHERAGRDGGTARPPALRARQRHGHRRRSASRSRGHAARHLHRDADRPGAAPSCAARTRPRSPSSTGSRPAIRVTLPPRARPSPSALACAPTTSAPTSPTAPAYGPAPARSPPARRSTRPPRARRPSA